MYKTKTAFVAQFLKTPQQSNTQYIVMPTACTRLLQIYILPLNLEFMSTYIYGGQHAACFVKKENLSISHRRFKLKDRINALAFEQAELLNRTHFQPK